MRDIPSIIFDTKHFLQKLENNGMIPGTAIICTIDEVGLYPHIPHSEGIDSLRSAISTCNVNLPVDKLLALANLVLENNFFEFDGKIYRQKLGTVIGTKFAPAYANIFMGDLECRILDAYDFRSWIWWRYLDDVFVIWLMEEKNLNFSAI